MLQRLLHIWLKAVKFPFENKKRRGNISAFRVLKYYQLQPVCSISGLHIMRFYIDIHIYIYISFNPNQSILVCVCVCVGGLGFASHFLSDKERKGKKTQIWQSDSTVDAITVI